MPLAALTPRQQVNNAEAVFILAAKLHEACESGRFPLDLLSPGINIETGGEGLHLSTHLYTRQELTDVSFNIMLYALGAIAIIVDEAVNQVVGPKNPTDTSDLGSARAIVYQIRNAFAHGPTNPHWEIAPKYQRVYTVTASGATIAFDGAALNGQGLVPAHFGGHEGIFRIMQYCRDQMPVP